MTARGIITTVESETSQDYGFHLKGTGRIKLQSDKMLPAQKAAELGSECDRLFTTMQKYQELVTQAESDPGQCDDDLERARALLKTATDSAKSELVRSKLQGMLDGHANRAAYARKSARRLAGVLNKPAADWTSTDLAGKSVKLEDFRGKVVVMDFWYRGCGWCMFAMPQVKQLADDYKGQPVVFLGMNTDRNPADAQVVVKTFGLDYPTIRAEGIPEKYGVEGFPTLVIVDPAGIVREFHVGFSPTLRDDMSRRIKQLLPGE